tara:strand:- start:1929 stop:3626 length:1698 start_codon:yes stop_codon:yes gene_type:complete
MGILDFFSNEARQQRGAAMDQFGRDVGYYVPPELRGLLGFAAEMTPSATLDRASQKSSRMLAPGRTPMQRVGDFGEMLSETAGVVAPVVVAGRAGLPVADAVQEAYLGFSVPTRATGRAVADRLNQPGPMPTVYSNPLVPNINPTRREVSAELDGLVDARTSARSNGGPPLVGLLDALNARSAQMDLRPADRIQPAPGGSGFLDRDYQTPAPGEVFDDLAAAYPRNPDPTAALPKNDRARVLVDRREEIAEALARRIEATGQMDADTRYFYHSDGPLYRAARAAGLSDEGAQAYLRDLSNNIAATSPRTQVEDNLRSATLVMAKDAQGVPFRDVIGAGTTRPDGTPGISERGYPMMTGSGGIHGNLLDDVAETGTINTLTNPKPATFGPNLAGNRSGVTVDTHAIRGTLQTLNEIEPGAVPEGFILPQHRDAYAADPTILTPDMIDDTLANQMVGPRGDTTRMQTEYPVFADIWHDAADRLGVSPAEAQSMGWFGFGDQTNLGSARATPVDIFDERLSVTAQALGVPVDEAARLVFNRQVPLLSVGGLGLLGLAAGNQPAQGDGT